MTFIKITIDCTCGISEDPFYVTGYYDLSNEQLKFLLNWHKNIYETYIGDEFITIYNNTSTIEILEIEPKEFQFIKKYGNPFKCLEQIHEFNVCGFFEPDYVYINDEENYIEEDD